MNIKQIALNEKSRLEQSIADKEAEIARLPEGKLQCFHSGNHYNWYVTVDSQTHSDSSESTDTEPTKESLKAKRKYIPKSQQDYVENLALKRYLQCELTDEKRELMAINMYLRHCLTTNSCERFLDRNSEYRRLLQPYLNAFNSDIQAWLSDRYTGPGPNANGEPMYMSQAGYRVRSKSEQIIVSWLVKYHIPFKYEQPVFINGRNVFPDFTLMNPRTREILIWEHFGRMDDVSYVKSSMEKVKGYCSIGYCPGDNLIMTFETNHSGIDESLIEHFIKHYLL